MLMAKRGREALLKIIKDDTGSLSKAKDYGLYADRFQTP